AARHTRAAGEARWRRAELPQHEQTFGPVGGLGGETLRYPRNPLPVSRRADPEHGHPPPPPERETPPPPHPRGGAPPPPHPHARPVPVLPPGPTPDDARVRGRPSLEEVALAPFGLEQDELVTRQRVGQRDARNTAAGSHVDDRPVVRADEVDRAQRVLEQHPAGAVEVECRQPGCRDDGPQPVVKRARRRRSDWAPPPRSPCSRLRSPSAARGRA